MITDAIFNVIFTVFEFVFDFIPIFDFDFDLGAFQTFCDIVKSVSYLLPMDTIVTILLLIVAINTFKVIVSLVKTLWQLLPLL